MDANVIEKLLTTWNPHFTNLDKGAWVGSIPREFYLSKLKNFIEMRHSVILTGARRAGKSTLMNQLMGWLIKEQKVPAKNVLYLFFEDILVAPYLEMGWKLLEEIFNYYLERFNPQGKIYLFLDEIQGIFEFNRWIASKYERKENIKFILSGSRRSLIESQSATVLTGRNVQIDIYPFNFSEYLSAKNVILPTGKIADSQTLHYLNNYLFEGGFPEIVLSKTEEEKRAIASGYYHDAIIRDVLTPNNLRNASDIEVLGLQIMADFTKTHTFGSLAKPRKLAVDTVKNYLEYFNKANLFFESPFFSYKTKESQDIQKPRKIYVVDNGLRNFNIPLLRPDFGQCAENVVFMELVRRGAIINYWKHKQEVDFVVLNPKLSLINVTYTDSPSERESTGLLEAMIDLKLDKGLIITKNYFGKKTIEGKMIEYLPLWSWLL